ncbi:MAG: radical SAM/SPASM domain-containing protein [Candidatus Hodarchaeales archaeon]
MRRWQRKARRLRSTWKKKGILVPPFIVFSITNRCNLRCHGCYARVQQRNSHAEISSNKLRNIIAEANELGISFILLVGGEPLLRQEILDIAKDFPEIIFPLLTNGLLLDEKLVTKIRRLKNVVPFLSLEGHEEETDQRRGQGVYQHLLTIMDTLKKQKIFFGASLTLTRNNFDVVMDEAFVKQLIAKGCKAIGFVDYIPVEKATIGLEITTTQRNRKTGLIDKYRATLPSIIMDLPGDEATFGGCIASGRGFIHISPGGHVEPCPFVPISDSNLTKMSLRRALQSDLLRKIRKSGKQNYETKFGCALWEQREWLDSVTKT